ncbi:MAG: hypothetical protein JO116_01315 [Planctomycetaceae bacterium]|nr:hypothetical protein [Planctomycetaceae bacterium]
MSGPIVRKYGFPNFEKIFGERELQHGVEELTGATPDPEAAPANPPAQIAKEATQAIKKKS